MASYALLLACSGFQYDLIRKFIGFDPIRREDGDALRFFWSLATGWGEYLQTTGSVCLAVLYGTLAVQDLSLPLGEHEIHGITLDERTVAFVGAGDTIHLDEPLPMNEGSRLIVRLAPSRHSP